MSSTSTRAALAAWIVLASGAAVLADADLSTVPRIRIEEFKKDLDQDKLLAIDVRAGDAYRAGHIPGAINVPLSALSEHLARLKAAKRPIVAYCA